MATSINGFGRAFYGKRDFESDGSYITTKWFICAFMPMSPSLSLRVLPVSTGIFNSEYEIIEELPVCWKQAFYVYAYAWGAIPLYLANFEKIHSQSIQWMLMAFVISIPFALRFFARRRS